MWGCLLHEERETTLVLAGMASSLCTQHCISNQHTECPLLLQNAQAATAAAAAAAVVREATASAVMDVLEGESEEEKAAKLAAAKESRMRKVIRLVLARSALCYVYCSHHDLSAIALIGRTTAPDAHLKVALYMSVPNGFAIAWKVDCNLFLSPLLLTAARWRCWPAAAV